MLTLTRFSGGVNMNSMQPAAYAALPMSPAFLDQARVFQPSNDPDEAARETIGLMTSYIHGSARDPLVQAEARGAVASYPSMLLALAGIAGDDPRLTRQAREQGAAESCWSWAKHNLDFVHHSKLLALWLGRGDALQLLVSPDVIVHALRGSDREARGRARKGDCAVYSPLICALLESLGLDWELVIAAVDANQPDIFSHVWPRAVLSDGRRVSLDASHGPYPGWQVPARDIHRLQVFDSSGRAVADRGSSFAGLGEYIATGLGECITAYNDDGSSYQSCLDTSPPPFNAGGGGTNWASVFGNLANQWTQIGGRVIAPQTTYTVGPGGQVSYSTPGAAPVPSILPTSLGSSSTLLWVGGGVAALLLGAMAFGGRK
jgi:hypothetical protein